VAKLIIGTWWWGSKYPLHYVERLRDGVARQLSSPHQFRVFTPPPEDAHLTEKPGCLARMRAFEPAWQADQGLKPGDRLVCLDLDLIGTGPLDALFDRPEPFAILQGANAANPCPYNGSVWMLQAGYRPDVWDDLLLDGVTAAPFYEFPDDQGWLAHKIPGAAGWTAGPDSGIYAFQKPGWPSRSTALPAGARMVAFPGWRDPAKFTGLEWVREHWGA
jgi:hypothetical protein